MLAVVERGAGVRVRSLIAIGGAAIAAAAASALSTSHPFWAVTLVGAVVIGLSVALRIELLQVLLVFTIFIESLSLGGGLHIARLAGAVALVVVTYFLITGRTLGFHPNALLLSAGCYGAWMLLSAYWASSGSEVFRQLLSYLLAIAFMLTFALLVRSERDLRLILATLAFGACLFGIVALAQYVSTGESTRAVGLQGDANYFAEYQVVALPAVLALAALERRRAWRTAYYGVTGVIILSVAASLSRGGLLALIIVIAATIVVPWKTFFRRPTQKVVYAAAVGTGILLALFVGSSAFVSRAGTILHPGSDRGSGRLDLWSAAWRGWKEHPWLGLGEGNFRVHALDLLQTTPGVNTAAHYVAAGREVHNAYLETLTELGPLGLALFLCVIVLTARYFVIVHRRARRARDELLTRVSIAFLFSLLAYTVSAFFLSNELQKPLWILAGIALALDVMSRRRAARTVPLQTSSRAPVRL
jgi:O-antigen ligase